MSTWINADERLPKDFETVICRVTGGMMTTGFCTDQAIWHTDRRTFATVTHWTPLPEPPKED